MSRRLLREEGGFTLTEVLVTMMLMLVVMFALYSIFDMSIRTFSYGNDKVEAVENARLGLEKMARELRAAYPYDRIDNKTYLFWDPANPSAGAASLASTSVTFGNDLNGSRRIHNTVTGAPDSGEQITYSLSGGGTLLRNGAPVVEFVKPGGLTFTYMDAMGNTVTSEANVRMVRIRLEVSLKRGIQDQPVTQILETDVTLRNRSG